MARPGGDGAGSGGAWLAKFLYGKGLRGQQLAWAWAIAMRESGGRPGIDNAGLNSNGSVDYGLFQINNRAHADKLRRRGWTVDDLRDPDKNFQIFMEISRNGKDYGAWGIANPDGSVTGWARSVQRNQPSNFRAFTDKLNQNLREWDSKYRSQYGTGAQVASDRAGQGGGAGGASGLGTTSDYSGERNVVGQLGGRNSAIEWALNEVNSNQQNYSGLCDHFVGMAYGYAHSGFKNATTHWQQSPDKHTNGDPPPGTLVFWTGGSGGHGHVAISLGGGMVASTDILRQGKVDVVSIDYINARWGNLDYKGWANPYFAGKTFKPASTDAELNARINYAAKASNARTSANTAVGGELPAAGRSSAGGGDTTAPATPIADSNDDGKIDEIDYARLARDWGLARRIIDQDPELRKIIERAVAKGWDQQRFQQEVWDSKWFRTHEATWRQAEAQRLTDPKTYASHIRDEASNAKRIAAQMGVTISDKQANEIAYKAYHYGWDDNQYRSFLAPMLKPGATGFYLGAAGQNEETLRQLAYNNGVTMTDDFYKKAIQSVAAGTRQLSDWDDYIRKQAAGLFPVFKDEIMAGVDARSLASPYLSTMSRVLDVNADQIDLTDEWIQKAMNSTGADGKLAAMGLEEFTRQLKRDPRWARTTTAMSQATTIADGIARMFGYLG